MGDMFGRMQGSVKVVLIASVLFANFGTASADDSVHEVRRHQRIEDSSGVTGELTRIVRLSSDRERHFVLYRSSFGDHLVIESGTSYGDGESGTEIRSVDGKSWVRRTDKLPFKAKNREDFEKLRSDHPELWTYWDSERTTLETTAGKWINPDSVWKNDGRQATSDVRVSLNFGLLEAIERAVVDGLFAIEGIPARHEIVPLLLYQPRCTHEPPTAKAATPDCGFDAAFGFPCSAKMAERIKNALKAGDLPESY